MLDDVVGLLRCPQCIPGQLCVPGSGTLHRDGASLRCAAGHSFDIASSGYVNLLPAGSAKNSGDTAAMVAARREFLAGGHYAGLADALADAAASAIGDSSATGCVVDVGAGTGYYLAAVLDRLPLMAGLALDLSKSALRTAARAHPRVAAIGCDAWRGLPVAEGGAALALSVFAPRDASELRRVLRDDGHLIVVTPAPDHLSELIEPLGLLTVDPRKDERLAAKLGPQFTLSATREYRTSVALDREALAALAAMGPGAWHTDPSVLTERVERLGEQTSVTVAATISCYRP